MGILWPHSNTVARTNADRRAPGALAYFFEAGTTTPRTTYRDAGLATPHMHPVVADAYGRFPAVFIDFGAYRERVKTAGGTQLWDTDDIPNPAPTDPGEGVDPESLLTTGEVFFKFANGTRTGAVRANGRTIGSAASTPTATERANDDCEDLFIALYNAMSDTLCPVSGGRGADAAVDFAAGKTLTLPDLRAAAPFGLDDMGNTAASLLGSAPVVAGSTILPGSTLGANTHTLATAELASHTHGGTTGIESQPHTHSGTSGIESATHFHGGTTGNEAQAFTHNYSAPAHKNRSYSTPGFAGDTWGGADTPTATGSQSVNHTHPFTTGTQSANHTHPFTTGNASATHTHDITTNPAGSGTAHNNLPRAVLGTWYIKL